MANSIPRLINIPTAAIAIPSNPAKKKAPTVVAAINITGATVLIIPVDKPSMMLIAGPDSLALAMFNTGLCSEVKYSVTLPMAKPQSNPMTRAMNRLNPSPPMK